VPRQPRRGSIAIMPAISVEDLRVTRGGREVLHGLSFAVEQVEVVGLLGPSGFG
jgi:ABC-2 type transport system ATP-binding protein